MTREKIYDVIRDVFAQPHLVLEDATTASDVEGWDSFNHMNLVMRLEEEFSISFATEEIGCLANVGDLVKAVLAKKGADKK